MNPANQALPPAFMKDVIKTVKKAPEVEFGTEQDKLLADLSDSAAWGVVKKFIESKQMGLAEDLRKNMGTASAAEIGTRFMVTDLANQVLSQLVIFVESPNKIYELRREEALRNNGNKRKK